MYCEYLIKEAKSKPEVVGECLEQFFFANYGLILNFGDTFGVQEEEKEDFSQLCYIALVQAFEAYQEGVNSFLSYYRRCVLHQFYVYKMEMRYPVKLSRSDFREVEKGEIKIQTVDYQYSYSELDDNLICIEHGMVADVVWSEIERVLEYQDALLLKKRFCEGVSYKSLADEWNDDPDRLRFRQHYLLTRLRSDLTLRRIAYEVFGIR